jgi:hypothetical protein
LPGHGEARLPTERDGCRLSVIVPFTDTRGIGVEALLSWTHGQTHPRDEFRVLLVAGNRSEVAEFWAQLAPHDLIVRAAGGMERKSNKPGLPVNPHDGVVTV